MKPTDVSIDAVEDEPELPDESVHPTIPLTPAERDFARWIVQEEIKRWMRQQE